MNVGTSSSLSVSISPVSTAFMLGRDCARLRSGSTSGVPSTGVGPEPEPSRDAPSIGTGPIERVERVLAVLALDVDLGLVGERRPAASRRARGGSGAGYSFVDLVETS